MFLPLKQLWIDCWQVYSERYAMYFIKEQVTHLDERRYIFFFLAILTLKIKLKSTTLFMNSKQFQSQLHYLNNMSYQKAGMSQMNENIFQKVQYTNIIKHQQSNISNNMYNTSRFKIICIYKCFNVVSPACSYWDVNSYCHRTALETCVFPAITSSTSYIEMCRDIENQNTHFYHILKVHHLHWEQTYIWSSIWELS